MSTQGHRGDTPEPAQGHRGDTPELAVLSRDTEGTLHRGPGHGAEPRICTEDRGSVPGLSSSDGNLECTLQFAVKALIQC